MVSALVVWAIVGALAFVPAWIVVRVTFLLLKFCINWPRYRGFPRHPAFCGIISSSLPHDTAVADFIADTWAELKQHRKEDGKLPSFINMGMSFDGSTTLCCVDPEAFRAIYSSTNERLFPKSYMFREMLEALGGRGLAALEGRDWHEQRKLLTPLFHLNSLAGYCPVMEAEARRVIALLQQPFRDQQCSTDPTELVKTYTMNIICEIAFGGCIDGNVPREIYVESEKWIQPYYIVGMLLMGPWLWKKLTFLPPVYHVDHGIDKVRQLAYKVIDERRKHKSEGRGTDDLIGVMLAAQEDPNCEYRVTDEAIASEVMTFLFAGYDTTSALLRWSCFYLSKHQDVQQLVYEEVMRVWPDDGPIDPDKIRELTYLKNVLSEILRLRPPSSSWTERTVMEDVEINGYVLPKGTNLGLGMQYAQLNPDYWGEDADEFRPERMGEPRHTFAYIPFSAGMRNCIGQKFAYQEAFIFVATLIKTTRLRLDEDPKRPVARKMVGLHVPCYLRVFFEPRTGLSFTSSRSPPPFPQF
jgi:cytochrome P450